VTGRRSPLLRLLPLLGLLGLSCAYPGYFYRPDPNHHLSKTDILNIETKADRFFLGPRFGKRGGGIRSNAGLTKLSKTEVQELLPDMLSDGVSFTCAAVERDNVYRCRPGPPPSVGTQ